MECQGIQGPLVERDVIKHALKESSQHDASLKLVPRRLSPNVSHFICQNLTSQDESMNSRRRWWMGETQRQRMDGKSRKLIRMGLQFTVQCAPPPPLSLSPASRFDLEEEEDFIFHTTYVPVKSKLQHPPRTFEFLENFWKIPPSSGRKAVQMPPPPGKLPDYSFNFSVASIMFLKLCM